MAREGGAGDSGGSPAGAQKVGYCVSVEGCRRCVPSGRLAHVAAVQAQCVQPYIRACAGELT